jgi:hypothetical protein
MTIAFNRHRVALHWLGVWSVALSFGAVAQAQQLSEPTIDVVQPAAATEPAPPADATLGAAVRFKQRETEVGDCVVQRFGLQLAIDTKIVQSGQVAHESSATMRRQQQRTVEVLEVAEGRAVKAQATFDLSRRQSPEQGAPEELAPLAIEGKSYLMARDGDKLSITRPDGTMPPLEEYKLVSESLESVGQPNPLALVLAGRELRVGQRVFVPREMAQSLLGFGSPELARVHRFELTLNRLAPPAEGAEPAAIFSVVIEVRPEDADDYAVHLAGEMAVEPATCRLASVDLAGPVQVSTIERTALGIYQYTMSGQLSVAIRSQFGADPK